MPNRKYGAFNIKMTNTTKEEGRIEPVVDWMYVRSPPSRPSLFGSVEPKCETQTLINTQQTLASLWSLRAVSLLCVFRPIHRRALLTSEITAAVFVVSAALAQPEVIRCLAPEVPITDLPEAVLAEYRAEITAEFEAYFTKLSDHIACLDTERSRALSEARLATETYSAFLNTPPALKDLP